MTGRPPLAPRALRRYLGQNHASRRADYEDLFQGWVHPGEGNGVPEDLEAIHAPTLVLHGDRDRVIHVSTGRALADRLPNARLEVLEGIGHLPQVEAPVRVARSIERFVGAL